jgi:hypothetical protein
MIVDSTAEIRTGQLPNADLELCEGHTCTSDGITRISEQDGRRGKASDLYSRDASS